MCVCVCGRRYGTRKTSAVVLAPTTCCSSHSNMYCVLKTTQSFQQKADINTTPRLPVSGSGRWQQTLNRSPYIEMALFFFFFFNTVLYIHPPGAQDGHDASRKKKEKECVGQNEVFGGVGWRRNGGCLRYTGKSLFHFRLDYLFYFPSLSFGLLFFQLFIYLAMFCEKKKKYIYT